MNAGRTKCSYIAYFMAFARLSAKCRTTSDDPKKSRDQTTLSWNEYFMGVARLSATRSKDPKTKVCEGKAVVGVYNNGSYVCIWIPTITH